MKYRVNWKYRAWHDVQQIVLQEGEVVELDDDIAAWLKTDSPGLLSAVEEERAVEEPPQDRMVKRGKKRQARAQ